MQLKYRIPFKSQEGVSAEFALKEKLLNIEGLAIDTSVNANKWQVPDEDLDFFVQSLQGAQVRLDHAESAMAVIGKVMKASRKGSQVFFSAEVGDLPIIERILRRYVNHVSAQVDSDNVECSKCHSPTRKEGMLIHLCPGAWEIVHKPKVRELSIVASPAYESTEFAPVGFAAAMNASQSYAASGRQLSPDEQKWILVHRIAGLREAVRDLHVLDIQAEVAQLQAMEASVDRMLRMVPKLKKIRERDYIDDFAQSIGMERMGLKGMPTKESSLPKTKAPKDIISSDPRSLRQAGIALLTKEDKARKRISLAGIDQ